jgi:hypothetical protein
MTPRRGALASNARYEGRMPAAKGSPFEEKVVRPNRHRLDRKILKKVEDFALTGCATPLCCCPAETRIPHTRDVLLFGLMIEPLRQFADWIGFCRVPEMKQR